MPIIQKHIFYAAISVSLCLCIGNQLSVAEAMQRKQSLRSLRQSEIADAVDARNRADRMLSAFKSKVKAVTIELNNNSQRFEHQNDKPSHSEAILQEARTIVGAYKYVMETYPRTKYSAYCSARLAGLHQFMGEFDEAVEVLAASQNEFVNTEEEATLTFSLGLLYSQAKQDPKKAIACFERIQKPTDDADHQGKKLYLSAQQQLLKCRLLLNQNADAERGHNDLRKSIPSLAIEMDRFDEFERKAQNKPTSESSAMKLPRRTSAKVPFLVALLPVVVLAVYSISRKFRKRGPKCSHEVTSVPPKAAGRLLCGRRYQRPGEDV